MMLPEWRAFLENAGATIFDGHVAHFGDPSTETRLTANGEVLSDLSQRALIAVRGADAQKYLQGQLTNDIYAVTEERSQLSAHCSPKGRALACFRVFRRGDAIYLAMPETLLEPSLARLRKYVLLSKVTLETDTDLVQIGYSGAGGDSRLREIIAAVPEEPDMVTHADGISAIRVPGPHARFELLGPLAAIKALWTELGAYATPVGTGPWSLLDILAGVPTLAPETADSFVPQMINLDLLNGISFKKGCYTGQEIVARTHYLGKLKRRMYRLHCPGTEPPPPSTAIYNAALRSDESVGSVIAAQTAPEGGIALLAVLQSEATHRGELRLARIDGPSCTLQALPYDPDAAAG
ncbi:MAG: folate-binding protein YgfZ [Gammaproteobacteria bacterium]